MTGGRTARVWSGRVRSSSNTGACGDSVSIYEDESAKRLKEKQKRLRNCGVYFACFQKTLRLAYLGASVGPEKVTSGTRKSENYDS